MPKLTCAACREPFEPFSETELLADYGDLAAEAIERTLRRRQTHCLECALEIGAGQYTNPGTLQHGTGGGQRVIRSPRGLS